MILSLSYVPWNFAIMVITSTIFVQQCDTGNASISYSQKVPSLSGNFVSNNLPNEDHAQVATLEDLWNFEIDEDEGETNSSSKYSESIREKRKLQTNEITKKVIMLLYDKDKHINETYGHIQNRSTSSFTTVDFIIRIQEKYEAATCLTYLDSVPELENNYFLYDQDLVNLENDDETSFHGDEIARNERRNRTFETVSKRYRLLGEECNPDEEWNFWRDMFIAAENDTIAVPKKTFNPGGQGVQYFSNYSLICNKTVTPVFCVDTNFQCNSTWCNISSCTNSSGAKVCSSIISPTPPAPPLPTLPPLPDPNIFVNPEEYDYVQIEPKDMMLRWNSIWIKYETKGVCNQKLLLECPFEPPMSKNPRDASEPKKCRCRSNGVGLPTVVLQRPVNTSFPIPENIFTSQYYTDLEENVHGSPFIHHGKYIHQKKCVVTANANIPYVQRDIHITNPCDFFLPMVGVCSAECHRNATCKSVNLEEKQAMRERSNKVDLYTRIRSYKLHEVYHQKCVCKPDHVCRVITNVSISEATTTTFRSLPSAIENTIFYFTSALAALLVYHLPIIFHQSSFEHFFLLDSS